MRETKRERLAKLVAAQAAWIAEHGGDEAGYVERYGSAADGGAAIYKADSNWLAFLRAELERCK